MTIREARAEDHDTLIDIWLRSVRATHSFLSPAQIDALLPLVRDGGLDGLEIWVLEEEGNAVGFLGMSGKKIEALFLAPEIRRRGGGRMMVEHARATKGKPLAVNVNEQNPEAVKFYLAMGFVVYDRSPVDDQGRPFPLLRMKGGEDHRPRRGRRG